jgi:uncharacterized protein (DUF2384 family)
MLHQWIMIKTKSLEKRMLIYKKTYKEQKYQSKANHQELSHDEHLRELDSTF